MNEARADRAAAAPFLVHSWERCGGSVVIWQTAAWSLPLYLSLQQPALQLWQCLKR